MTEDAILACSRCFHDRGLQLDAAKIGKADPGGCPQCSRVDGNKLTLARLEQLAHRYFVWGSLQRSRYGAAPLIQFNTRQTTSIRVAPWLASDVHLFEQLIGVGFFDYGPRLWMVGEVEPLKALQRPRTRDAVIQRILNEYPTTVLEPDFSFYRIRISPSSPSASTEYDGPPAHLAGKNRLDSKGYPVLYGSSDLQVCVHETRATAEDDLYVATLRPTRSLKLLDLSKLLVEPDKTEFESLDMAVHMLFLAAKHSYPVARRVANAARIAGYDGMIYSSYFSLLRIGAMPFETVYGISHRRIPQFQEYEQSKTVPNIALFGRPIERGDVTVNCIDRLMLNRVDYAFHFGPV